MERNGANEAHEIYMRFISKEFSMFKNNSNIRRIDEEVLQSLAA
jgi:hypothetical protein